MLILKNVDKQYGNHTALRQVDLEMDQGIYALLAPNGAGKTTLIKMLATLIRPTKGEILFNGQDIFSMDEAYRQQIGYLPQQFGYYRHYTPMQYLRYLAALKGIDKQEAKRTIPELLEKVALGEVMHKKMRKFSGGMIQRVGIAQALLGNPKVLILDEPTAGLDPKERARFRHLLSDLAGDRLIIISTHIVSDIEFIANRIVMLQEQRVLHNDSADQICQKLNGKVFQTKLEYSELAQLRKQFVILSEKQAEGKMLIRFISEQKDDPALQSYDLQVVEPLLEDVFLYVYQDEVGAREGSA